MAISRDARAGAIDRESDEPSARFTAVDFTHSIGPDAGLYPIGAGQTSSEHAGILVIAVVGAATAARTRRRRGRILSPEPQADAPPVALTRALHVVGVDAATPAALQAQHEAWRRRPDSAEPLVAQLLALLNRAIRAYRLAADDPYVVEVTRYDPRAAYVGWGPARELAAGRLANAIELPRPRMPRVSRVEQLEPAVAVARTLGGESEPLEGEELLLRARADLAGGRIAAAAVELRGALELLLSQLGGRTATEAQQRLSDMARTRLPVATSLARSVLDGDRAEVLESQLRALADEVAEACHGARSRR